MPYARFVASIVGGVITGLQRGHKYTLKGDPSGKRERFHGTAESDSKATLELLPVMETDMSIYKGDRHIILDTKFYRQALGDRFGVKKLHDTSAFTTPPPGILYGNTRFNLLFGPKHMDTDLSAFKTFPDDR